MIRGWPLNFSPVTCLTLPGCGSPRKREWSTLLAARAALEKAELSRPSGNPGIAPPAQNRQALLRQSHYFMGGTRRQRAVGINFGGLSARDQCLHKIYCFGGFRDYEVLLVAFLVRHKLRRWSGPCPLSGMFDRKA